MYALFVRVLVRLIHMLRHFLKCFSAAILASVSYYKYLALNVLRRVLEPGALAGMMGLIHK